MAADVKRVTCFFNVLWDGNNIESNISITHQVIVVIRYMNTVLVV